MVIALPQLRLNDVSPISSCGMPTLCFGDFDYAHEQKSPGCMGFIARFSVAPPLSGEGPKITKRNQLGENGGVRDLRLAKPESGYALTWAAPKNSNQELKCLLPPPMSMRKRRG